ncbi:MAG: GAF domain-containing protein [Actinobacteria bacterium]|nr:GAF domain-containing protein [Actinomycetota bacterium]
MDACTFLRLLLDEAPVAAFEEQVQRGRDAGLDPTAQERLQEASYLAIQLQLVLRERRRREVELAALYATAGDLTSIRDPQRVLQAIARRARQLLDADTAYLTLIDEERGDTYMRVTEGMVTADFARLRLPLGVGLGGLVAQTATPYYTADYLEDERFRHAQPIDHAVDGEHLRAILGVPLIAGDKVIGVLFAANRHPGPFSPDEVTLLRSLAAHAAIAIENARLFDRAHRALEELEATTAVVRAHSDAVERAAEAHERMTNVVLQGGRLDDLVAVVGELLGGTVVVVGPDGRLLAGRGDIREDTLAEEVGAALSAGRTVDLGSGDGAWAVPVGTAADPLGALLLRGRAELSDADRRTFERAAQATAFLLLTERSVAEAERRVRGELLDDLLAPSGRDAEAIERRARVMGVDLASDHLVLALSAAGADRHALRAAAGHQADRWRGLAGERDGAVVLLLPVGDPSPAEAVHAELSSALGVPVTCGVARATEASGLPGAFDEAERCRRTLIALGRGGGLATAPDLGVFALLFNQSGREDLDRFVTGALGPVLAYDEERGSELTRTLEAYFEAGGNLTRAAQRLHVHVNTLYQRCERISSLLGVDWQDPAEALRIHLALQVRRLQVAV